MKGFFVFSFGVCRKMPIFALILITGIMRKGLFIVIFLLCSTVTALADSRLDSLYDVLDDAIAHADGYIAKRQQRIDALERKLQQTKAPEDRYQLSFSLQEEYSPLSVERTCFYLYQCIALSEQMGNQQRADQCRARLAIYCAGTGYYDEGQRAIQTIDESRLDAEGKRFYYQAKYRLNGELAFYSCMASTKAYYTREEQRYEQLMLNYLPKNDDMYYQTRELELFSGKQYQAAIKLNDQWMSSTDRTKRNFALVALYRYLCFLYVNNQDEMLRWATEASIADVQQGVRDQGAMWELANQLMLRSDIERAYRYVSFLSNSANTLGSRQRSWQTGPLLSDLAAKYKQQSEQNFHRLLWAIAAVSVFFICALLLLFYSNRQRAKLRQARNLLAQSNQQLHEANDQLQQLNGQLKDANAHLMDSNHVKEEYVGRFMSLCSKNIDEQEALRHTVARLLKARDFDRLRSLSNDPEGKDRALEAFYREFDHAFLHLFPTFVDDFNALLKPEARIVPADQEQLTTALRIFALIRLGIEDSSKIASFLHYSVNTIYNYRAKVKNGALANRDDFEATVRNIGRAGGRSSRTNQ